MTAPIFEQLTRREQGSTGGHEQDGCQVIVLGPQYGDEVTIVCEYVVSAAETMMDIVRTAVGCIICVSLNRITGCTHIQQRYVL